MINLVYFDNVTDTKAKPLTEEVFNNLIKSPWTRTCVNKYRERNVDMWKRRIPAICWSATFEGGIRSLVGAKGTGAFMLDIDHISKEHPLQIVRDAVNTPLQLYKTCIEGREDELGILAVHASPSGDGLHVIALVEYGIDSILENQSRLANRIGTPFDMNAHDLSRIGFISYSEEWYYIDRACLFSKESEQE